MQLDITTLSLPVYEALASSVRLRILQLISDRDYSITELAQQLGLSKAITTKHIQKLELARLIRCKKSPGKSGQKKVPRLAVDVIEISFPAKLYHSYSTLSTCTQLGHFSNFGVVPTCGLATTQSVVGTLDDPLSFVSAERVNASLLWFSEGFVEYKIPNTLAVGQQLQMLEISFEIASEFPLSNNVWPSDITFYINGVSLGTWTCPGNYSDARGFYTPVWWPDNCSQYGLLRHIRINNNCVNMDGETLSTVQLGDLDIGRSQFIDFRIEVSSDAKNLGGVTLFGKGFGNHDQDIVTKLFYTNEE